MVMVRSIILLLLVLRTARHCLAEAKKIIRNPLRLGRPKRMGRIGHRDRTGLKEHGSK